MSWRDQLPSLGRGSFRGVDFKCQQVEDSGIGRRVAILEAPERDKPGHEDLGRSTEDIRFDAYLIGENYLDDLKALREALRKPGPGELVHPYWGVLRVLLRDPATVTHKTRERGYAVVQLRFMEVGEDDQARPLPDTAALVKTAADRVDAALINHVESNVTLLGQPQKYRNAVRDTVFNGLDALRSANSLISSSLAQVDEASAVIDRLGDEVEALLLVPKALGGKLLDLAATVFAQAGKVEHAMDTLLDSGKAITQAALDAATDSDANVAGRRASVATSAMDGVLGWGSDEEIFDSATPQREQTRLNVTAMISTIHVATLTGCSRALVEVLPESHGQAITIRDGVFVSIDAINDSVSDELYLALVDLGVAVSRHLTSISSGLPRVSTWVAPTNLNALLIAHLVYGDATRADEIAARNRLVHPGFVPAGSALEVLVDAA